MHQVDLGCDLTDSFEDNRAIIEQAHMHTHQYCFTHGEWCSLWDPVTIDFSGLPCEDNSRANRKRKFECGRFVPCYITWAKKHKALQTPLLILENTPETWQPFTPRSRARLKT